MTSAILASLVACSDEPYGLGLESDSDSDGPDHVSTYVDIHLEDGIEVCGGQLAAYDRFLERAYGLWTGGHDPVNSSPRFRAVVRVQSETSCGNGASCAPGREVWLASQLYQYHELAHVVHQAVDGRSAFSLEEGAAEAMGSPWLQALGTRTIERDSLFKDRASASGTDVSNFGIFTRFLIERHGSHAFRRYFQDMRGYDHPDPADFEGEFELVFGEPLDNAWSDFVAEPERRCKYDFWYCDIAEPIELPFELEGIACDDPETLGFSDLNGTPDPWSGYAPFRLLQVYTPVRQLVLWKLENAELMGIGTCGSCPDYEDIGPGLLELAPGTHVFVIAQIRGEPFHVSLTPTDEPWIPGE
jgi:hypothetical protein